MNGDWTAYEGTKTLKAPYSGNMINPTLYNQAAVQLVTKYLPLATASNGVLLFGPPNPTSEQQYIGRVDWNTSANQNLFVRYYLTHYFQQGFFNNNLLNTTNPELNDQEQSLTLEPHTPLDQLEPG